MILFAISLAFFAILASANRDEPNIAELKQIVLDKFAGWKKDAKTYQSAGYYTMGNETWSPSLDSFRDRLSTFPTDIPYHSLTIEQRSHHDFIVQSVKLYKRYPNHKIFSKLTLSYSERFKGDVLAIYVNKTLHNDLSEPTPAHILETVRQTIKHEEGVLINGELVKPSKDLEALYKELLNIFKASFKYYIISWLNSIAFIDNYRENCASLSPNCSVSDRELFDKYAAADKIARENNTPIDSQLKVDNLIRTMPEQLKTLKNFYSALQNQKLLCLLSLDAYLCNNRRDQ